jgi:hypothetical protein
VGGNQIASLIFANLILNLSFGHISYLVAPNEKCKLTFDMQVLKAFKLYIEISIWTKFTPFALLFQIFKTL